MASETDPNGRIIPVIIPPTLYREGKLEIIERECGGAPFMAFGDSAADSDASILAAARFPIVVNPHGRHADGAYEKRWPVLMFTSTIGGGRPYDPFTSE